MIDNVKNFAKATVSTGYDASATSVDVSTGHGAYLPTVPFNVTWWNSTDYADPSDDPNVEIVRVTAISTDTLTVTRAQEGTSASTKNTGGKTYKIIAGLTAKTINTDLIAALAQTCNGRLTLESGVPVSTSDQSAKTTIYYTPYGGNRLGLFDGTSWNFHTFSELSLALGTLTSGKNYDVFVYNNAGTLTLELSAAWSSDTARTDALALQDGVYVKSGATTRRYIGTVRTTSTTTTEDSVTKRFVWNAYNRKLRAVTKIDETAAGHTYSSTTLRQYRGDTSNQVEVVVGLVDSQMSLTGYEYLASSSNVSGISFVTLAIGRDSTSAVAPQSLGGQTFVGLVTLPNPALACQHVGIVPLGYHYYALLQAGNDADTITWYAYSRAGLLGVVEC